MNTNRTTRMLRGSAVVLSLSATLFAGAGTAQATEPTYFYNSDNSMQVIYGGGVGAIYATVVDTPKPRGRNGILPIPLGGSSGHVGVSLQPADDGHRAESLGTDNDHLPANRRPLRR